MKELEITDQQIERADELYEFGRLKDSIMKGHSNFYGALGEILIYDRYKDLVDLEYAGDYDYDLIIKDRKVDVKTKRTTVEPLPHFLVSIADANTSQDCDYYCFVRVHEFLDRAWLLGWKHKSAFFNNAVFYKKGDVDPESDDGWVFKGDCWNMKISELD